VLETRIWRSRVSEQLVPSPARFAVMGGQVEGRGGSWNNEARNARCAYRNRNNPDNRNNNLGFRALLQLTGNMEISS
jgi:formylglycine-generating enzyme required for sulfatase activity